MKRSILLVCISLGWLLVTAAALAQEAAVLLPEPYGADSCGVPSCGPFRLTTAPHPLAGWTIASQSPFAVRSESVSAGNWLGEDRYRVEGELSEAGGMSWLRRPGGQAAETCELGCCASDATEPGEVFNFFAKTAFDAMSKADHLSVAARHLEAAGLVEEAAKLRDQLAIEAPFEQAAAPRSETSDADPESTPKTDDSDETDR
jgi:hypothetical protein